MTIVERYIETGEPVSSGDDRRRHGRGQCELGDGAQ